MKSFENEVNQMIGIVKFEAYRKGGKLCGFRASSTCKANWQVARNEVSIKRRPVPFNIVLCKSNDLNKLSNQISHPIAGR